MWMWILQKTFMCVLTWVLALQIDELLEQLRLKWLNCVILFLLICQL